VVLPDDNDAIACGLVAFVSIHHFRRIELVNTLVRVTGINPSVICFMFSLRKCMYAF
jgi:hypothetical protein